MDTAATTKPDLDTLLLYSSFFNALINITSFWTFSSLFCPEINHTKKILSLFIRRVESFISANHFQYPRTWQMIYEKLYFIFMVWRNYIHWIEFGKFSSPFYGEYFWLNRMQRFIKQWTFNINMIFLIDWHRIWFKNY